MIDSVSGAVFRRILFGAILGISFCIVTAAAQGPIQPVQWSGSAKPGTPLKRGSKVAIELSAEVQGGWHVYGLSQVPGGPTPLRVTMDENDVVHSVGATSGTAPVRKHDPSLDLETESYTGSFALHFPAQVNDHPDPGKQVISVAVRFQACSDRTCLPPRTVHVSVPIEILPGS
jgi:hypothetical protein